MKLSAFWVMFFVVWTALMFLNISSYITGSRVHDMLFTNHGDGSTGIVISRKLKETNYKQNIKGNRDEATVKLDDYHPIDPVPSSKASVKPGPIEHGTPLIPYIPKPSPPDHPKRDGSG
ncbi:hypothetical protein PanWU01x14_196640 [Parasponia andersonii]|uniref:Transmembrane protein n=1 Tax=Parasponia andersonii TaxID=3476 RepID=A0A2P5BZR2_PARAD|nr:hypothetical protein PanWU01x14_196640 [Parasponia andersonii]